MLREPEAFQPSHRVSSDSTPSQIGNPPKFCWFVVYIVQFIPREYDTSLKDGGVTKELKCQNGILSMRARLSLLGFLPELEVLLYVEVPRSSVDPNPWPRPRLSCPTRLIMLTFIALPTGMCESHWQGTH